MKHFCEELKAAREFKKVTLEEISSTTKINITFLQALEDGCWDILPEPYIKGFLKAYAQCVGMNVFKVLKKYDELEKGVEPTEEELAEGEPKLAPPEPPPPPVRSRFPAVKVRTYGLLYGLLVVAIVVVGIILLSGRDSEVSEEPTQAQQEGTGPATTDTSEMQGVVPVAPPSGGAEAVQEPFTVFASFEEPCYVEIVLDDSVTRDYLFQAGQSRTWRPIKSLWLKIGNAGGARVTFNGQELGVLGARNQVATLTLGREGITEKVLGPVPAAIEESDSI